MGSFSYLQVMMTYIRAWMSLKFGQIRPRTTELAALKRLKNCCFHFFLALYNHSQVSIVALWATCLAHLSRRLVGELIVYPWSGVRPSSVVVVHNFKHVYLCSQLADNNQILSEASLGWGKGCIRFWARSDQNSGFHGNRKLP